MLCCAPKGQVTLQVVIFGPNSRRWGPFPNRWVCGGRLDSPSHWRGLLPSSVWRQHRAVKQRESGSGSVGTTYHVKGRECGEVRMDKSGRSRALGGERPMGNTTYGRKGQRPIGAASFRLSSTKASSQIPPPPRVPSNLCPPRCTVMVHRKRKIPHHPSSPWQHKKTGILCCVVLCCVALCCVVLCCVVLCCVVLCCVVLCCVVLCCVVLNTQQTTHNNTTPRHTAQHNTTQHHTTPHNTTQHNRTQHNAICLLGARRWTTFVYLKAPSCK